MAPTRRAEVPDKIDDLDNIVHDLFPHLAIQIDFLHTTNSTKPPKQKGRKTTYTFDPDNLHKDTRDGTHVRYARRQASRFTEHGYGNLERAQLCICVHGLELYISRSWDIKITAGVTWWCFCQRWSVIRGAGRLAPEAKDLGGVGCNGHSGDSLLTKVERSV
jgi:hypothetical protein